MSAIPGPQAPTFEISSIPKLVVIRLIYRHLPAESASLADNPPCTHLEQHFTVSPCSAGWVHLRRSFRRAFRTLNAINRVTHAHDANSAMRQRYTRPGSRRLEKRKRWGSHAEVTSLQRDFLGDKLTYHLPACNTFPSPTKASAQQRMPFPQNKIRWRSPECHLWM